LLKIGTDVEAGTCGLMLRRVMIESNVEKDIMVVKSEERLGHMLEGVAMLHANIPSWHSEKELQEKVTENISGVMNTLFRGNVMVREVWPGLCMFTHVKMSVALYNVTQTRYW